MATRIAASTALILAGVAAFAPTPVFQAYVGYPPCYRQPVLVIAGDNVLAFAEGRNNTYCSGTSDGFPKYINLRVSTDAGRTFGAQQTLYEGNIDFLSAVYDPATQVVFLTIQLGSTVIITESKDGGLSWSTPAPLSFKTNYPGAYPAVGHGIALRADLCGSAGCAAKAGRIIMPFVCHSSVPPTRTSTAGDVACVNCYSCVLFSDDHGASWATGAISNQDGSREATLVQLMTNSTPGATDAVLYANERNMGNATGHKWHALSVDGGDAFTSFGVDPGLVDSCTANWTGVVSGASRFDTVATDGSVTHRVVLATPLSPTSRSNMGLYTSLDETATWSSGTLLQSGPAGYSDMLQLNATHMAILFENGAQEFSQQISFGTFDVSAL